MKLRPYQNKVIDDFYNYYSTGNGKNGILVLPTAAGKSIICGKLITDIVRIFPNQRVLLLSHVRELISQNHSKIMLCWPEAPAGIYSAGLNKRQSHHPIVSASIQSVYKKANMLGHRDLVFIDESHLLNSEGIGMYRHLLKEMMIINPKLKVCGLTATPYRMDSGPLTAGENALFNDIISEIFISDLLDEGYLTPPISKASLAQADMEGVKRTAGEFNIKQMAERFDQKAFMNAALDSDLPYFADRKCIALFCPTIENAQHVAEGMVARGIACEVIHGDMGLIEREDKLERFRNGQLRALASVGVITTGTDIPGIDCIVLLRATESPGLYQQIVGRGFRVVYAEGYDLETKEGRLSSIRNGPKPNFLILDHGANIERHGAITHVEKPKARVKGERRAILKADVRICDFCRSCWPMEVTVCGTCMMELVDKRDMTANLSINASNADIMGTPFSRGEKAEWFGVDEVQYSSHLKKGGTESFKVTYHCGIMQFNEWLKPSVTSRWLKWWKDRNSDIAVAVNIRDALHDSVLLKRPSSVLVFKNKQGYYEVMDYEFNKSTKAHTGSIATTA